MLDYGEHEGFLNEIENVQRISSVVAADLEEYSNRQGAIGQVMILTNGSRGGVQNAEVIPAHDNTGRF